ncbi:hypothetical protein Tco_1054417 [Tanacetum coccineum]|uniref:DUF4219 domain-containing protein/UBN2 domain-containing protein n=1 Tax=Tanacetum coccineum TaxID=301880 RepID=A0ABQ5GWP9_9ASTR
MKAHLAPNQPVQVNKITSSCEICSDPHDTQYCMENPKKAFVRYASSRLVSNFMASQEARLSKFEADFKQQQSEMTSKIDTVLKAITDRIMGALPSDMVKNSKLNVKSTSPVFKPEEEEREETDNPENINTNPSSPPDPSVSFITKKVRQLNSFFESLGLVPQSSDTEFVCTKRDDSDVMFIKIIKKNDDSREEEPEVDENAKARELEVEYFDIFPTRSELAYHKYLMSGPIPSIFLRNPIITEGCRKAHLLEDKQIPSVGVFDEIRNICVRSKDLDHWHVITNGDFQPIEQNPETKLDEVIHFEKQSDDLKKRLAKNNEAKMVIYNAFSRKEYERIFICNTEKEIWKTLLIIHQGNSQVKDNKIDLLVQQCEQFVISIEESIDSTFARFNTIITSLKALNEGYSSKNYVRKFLRALHPKWRAKVTAIEDSKALTSLSLDELIGNLKVHEMIINKDSKIVKAKGERKSLTLKAKKESSDDECLTFGSEDKEYAMTIRDLKSSSREEADPNHLIGECPIPPKDKNQRAFVGGSWSDSGEEDDVKANDETCLVAQASSEVRSESSYFCDENSSIDDFILENEYDRLCKMSLKIITKNKRLKSIKNSLENELSELKEKLSTLEKNKGVDLECTKCQLLKIDNEKLKEEAFKLTQFEKSTHCLNEMLNNQNPSGDNLGLGFNSFEASTSGTKKIKFVKTQENTPSGGGSPNTEGDPYKAQTAPKAIKGPPVCSPESEKFVSFQKSILGPRPKHIMVNNVKVPVASDNEIIQFYKPSLKPGVGFSKLNFRSKTPPPRRVNNHYPRSKTPQPKRNVGRQNQPRGFPVTWYNFQPQSYMPWGICPLFPHPNQM